MIVSREPSLLAAQADVLLVLARLANLPCPELVSEAATAVADIAEVAVIGGFSAETGQALADLCRSAAQTDPLVWQGEAHRLFGPNAQCPIHEAGWIRRDRAPIMSDIAGFAKAFGLRLDETCHDRFDHLAAEVQLLGLMLVMRSRAMLDGNVEAAEVVGKAADDFVADHLGCWLPGFCAGLAVSEQHEVYAMYAVAIARVWDELCVQHGWEIQPVTVPRNISEPQIEDEPYGCGHSTGSVAET